MEEIIKKLDKKLKILNYVNVNTYYFTIYIAEKLPINLISKITGMTRAKIEKYKK